MDTFVSICACRTYDYPAVRERLLRVLEPLGGLDWVSPGMRVAVKVNLVAARHPDAAATTHPALVRALCELLIERGAEVVVGDSPGGLYTPAVLKSVYAAAGMLDIEKTGAKLNYNTAQSSAHFPDALVAHRFEYTAWLDGADAVITFAKLKTHGFLGLTACVKNLFGIIPGTKKPEYHYLYPEAARFADMLIDLCEFVRPKLAILDAVVGMEGNGPTSGTPRPIGALLASKNPHALDLAAAHLIGVDSAPQLECAYRRGLAPKTAAELTTTEPLEPYAVPGYKSSAPRRMELIATPSPAVNAVVRRMLNRKPVLLPEKCVSCGICARTCPVHAITLSPKPVFDRKTCIRCFCCQEFCPKSAIEVRRGIVARLLIR